MRYVLSILAITLSGSLLASPSLWTAPAMDRVFRTSEPGTWQPAIRAARNEWESLQLVLHATPEELKQATLTATSLQGPHDALIPAPVLLREDFVAITHSSEHSPMQAGMYPDALVPQTFPWPPLPGSEAINQPYWIDIYVPPDAVPGDYQGTLTIKLTSGTTLSRAYTLKVWDFELPRLPTLKSSIFIMWRRIAAVHGFDEKASRAEPPLQAILNDYYDMLVEHRLSPHEVWATYPDDTDPLSDASFAHMEAGLRQHLLQRQAGTLGLPLWPTWPLGDPLGKDRKAALDYVARYYRICEKLGCADRLYKIFGELDEPNSAEQYALVREWGKFFTELRERHHIKVPLLITEQIKPDNKSWGSLIGSVDIWVPHVGQVWQDTESAKAPHNIDKRLAAGEKVWTYTALVQAPEEWMAAHDHPKRLAQGQPPVWLTDYPSMNYRILGWLAPQHGITGFTYWNTSFWKGDDFDVWANNGTYPHDNDEMYNGDGFLIYPARQKRHGREGPIASIRLKWIRESIDDHDYFALMQQRGFGKNATEAAQTFARGFGDWDDNPTALDAARTRLGEHLERIHARRTATR
jgi:hypothetical protein